MRAIFSPFGLVHHKPDAQPRPRGGFGYRACVIGRWGGLRETGMGAQRSRFAVHLMV